MTCSVSEEHATVKMELVLSWMLTAVLFLPVVDPARMRCSTEQDCPRGAYCFKDECPRCICPQGQHEVKLFSDGQLYPLCEDKPPTTQSPLVGEPCNSTHSHHSCPYSSVCADSGACACLPGFIPHDDRSYCRPAVYGEECDGEHPCDSYQGLQCQEEDTGRCGCGPAFRRPNEWTRFILQRWNYSLVEEGEQKCVARAVGEPCDTDIQCSAVGGSGALCGHCGFCQCQQQGHVPDVLGTKCGPGQRSGQACSLHTPSVCDGTQGLQCGDVCDLYSYSYRTRLCTCSQMHDKHGSQCKPKVVESPCSTDLDCYPIQNGYGYCNRSRCAVHLKGVSTNYQPHLASRPCTIDPDDVTVSLQHYHGDGARHNGTGMDVHVQKDSDVDNSNVTVRASSSKKRRKDHSVHSSGSGATKTVSFHSWIILCECVVITVLLVLNVSAMETAVP